MKKLFWISLLLLWPLKPAQALTVTSTANTYMVQNTSGTDTSGNFCYDFQTRPTCSARITNLTATISSASIPSGATFYIQNTATPNTSTQVFNVSTGAVTQTLSVSTFSMTGAFYDVTGSSGVPNRVLGTNAGFGPTWQANNPVGTIVQTTTTFIVAAATATLRNVFVPTGIQVTITPQFATSMIRCTYYGFHRTTDISQDFCFTTIYGNTTNLAPGGGTNALAGFTSGIVTTGAFGWTLGATVDDLPGSTSAKVYSIQMRNSGNATSISFNASNTAFLSCQEIKQ